VIQIQFGSPVGWAPEAEDEMVRGVLALFGETYIPTQTVPYSQNAWLTTYATTIFSDEYRGGRSRHAFERVGQSQ
jgi:hypothetical protein